MLKTQACLEHIPNIYRHNPLRVDDISNIFTLRIPGDACDRTIKRRSDIHHEPRFVRPADQAALPRKTDHRALGVADA